MTNRVAAVLRRFPCQLGLVVLALGLTAAHAQAQYPGSTTVTGGDGATLTWTYTVLENECQNYITEDQFSNYQLTYEGESWALGSGGCT